jgi:hypothetical protein
MILPFCFDRQLENEEFPSIIGMIFVYSAGSMQHKKKHTGHLYAGHPGRT